MGATARGAATSVVDAMARKGAGHLGGQLYGAKRLRHLKQYLARRGVDLVADDAAAGEAGGMFRVTENQPRPQLILRSKPTRYEVWHELGHYLHWKQLGRSNSAYAGLSRAPTNNVPERFVYENVLNTNRGGLGRPEGRWGLLNPAEQADASAYYMRMGGIR